MKKLVKVASYFLGSLFAIYLSLAAMSFNEKTVTVIKRDTIIVVRTLKYDSLQSELLYQQEYQQCIEFIMQHEGLRVKQYLCPAGRKTIGYGHVIKPGEEFKYFTAHKAYLLLKEDFDLCIEYVKRYGYTKRDNKQLAMAHFGFALGVGTLGDFIRSGQPWRNTRAYINYKNLDGEWIKGHTRTRDWEIELYYRR